MSDVDVDKLPRTRMLFLYAEYEGRSKSNVWADIRDIPNNGVSINQLEGLYVVRIFPAQRKGMAKRMKNPGRSGIIYSFPFEETEGTFSIYGGYAKVDGWWENQADVLKWQAKHDAFRATYEDMRKEDEFRSKNVVNETLEPIRDAYKELSWRERRRLLAHVIEVITK